jgi:hypothetical protein
MSARDLKGTHDEVADYGFGTGKGVYSPSVTVSLQGITTCIIGEPGNNSDRICPCLLNQYISGSQQTVGIPDGAPTRPRCCRSQFHV